MNINFEEMRLKELKLFIIEFNRASQLDRSFSKSKVPPDAKTLFRQKLLETCIGLMSKVDDSTLKNKMIRDAIRKLKETDIHISYGQAQKVINVCLKQYCFLTRAEAVVRELDCPLDSTTMKGYAIAHNRMNLVTEDDYLQYQSAFDMEFDGFRILKDLDYDDARLNVFLGRS